MQQANFLAIITWTILEFLRSLKVIRGLFRVMRGHMIQNSKRFVLYNVLQCSAFFYIHAYVPKCKVLRSSEVNEGQPEVSHLTSHLSGHIFIVILLSLAFIWYATCLYSSDFYFFYFFEVCKLRSKTLTIVPRSNEVMDTKSDARFGKYGSK